MASRRDSQTVTLVAHRGYPSRYPENTRVGLEAAVAAGAKWLELDVQLTADQQAVVFHDHDLQRVCGVEGTLHMTDAAELRQLRASCPAQFGSEYADEPLLWLSEFAQLLTSWSHCQAFVELKGETADQHGHSRMAEVVAESLQPALSQCTLISMEPALMVAARERIDRPVGWVLPDFDAATRAEAERLGPDYLFASAKRLPADGEPLWNGRWTWVAYTVNDPQQLAALGQRGIRYVETDAIGELLDQV